MSKTTSQDVIKVIWKACDTFRGTMDSSKYKDYILTMLFVKYVSDFYKEKLEELKVKFGDNEDRIQKSLKREKFQLDPTCTFDVIYENRNAENLGELLLEMNRGIGTTLILATHSADLAKKMSRILMLEEGKLIS